ncbi:MAG: hypothetical protein CM1200mP8_6500 [Chloroflexota bacterium]|nr:MAG: hypothetical protein CM1200mP8_6500 [Chloroflexota bacterium]
MLDSIDKGALAILPPEPLAVIVYTSLILILDSTLASASMLSIKILKAPLKLVTVRIKQVAVSHQFEVKQSHFH